MCEKNNQLLFENAYLTKDNCSICLQDLCVGRLVSKCFCFVIAKKKSMSKVKC